MNNQNTCSQFEICESLPLAQKTLCYQEVGAEVVRHDKIMDYLGEGLLITIITLVSLFFLCGLGYIIKDSFFK